MAPAPPAVPRVFTGRAVTGWSPAADHVRVFVHRARTTARAASVPALLLALVAGLLLAPAASAGASAPAASADDDGSRLTFGVTTASGGVPDDRGFIAVDAPPGSVLFDGVGVVNLSDAPLGVDLYTADVTNAEDGGLDVADRDDAKSLAGAWVTLQDAKVDVPAQGAQGPGVVLVPVTIDIPADAEPGDHLAAVLSSVTSTGAAGENTPAVDLEQRVGVRVYVRVQGDIRPGLTITDVHTRFRSGSALGAGTLIVSYTLTNSGNVRYGVHPTVRASGIFGLLPQTAAGGAIEGAPAAIVGRADRDARARGPAPARERRGLRDRDGGSRRRRPRDRDRARVGVDVGLVVARRRRPPAARRGRDDDRPATTTPPARRLGSAREPLGRRPVRPAVGRSADRDRAGAGVMTGRIVRRWGRVLAAVLLSAGVGLAGAGGASADDSFGGTLYLADADTLADVPVGAALRWDEPVTALPAPGDQTNRLLAPAGADSVVTFVGPVGRESDPTSWNATAPWELTPPGQWFADVTPYHLVTVGSGNPAGTGATAATGGDYSLGVAYLADGGSRVVRGGLYFVHIHLTGDPDPAKATYTWQPVQGTVATPRGADPTPWFLAVGGVVVATAGGWVLWRRRRARTDLVAAGPDEGARATSRVGP